jgi:hypothetical protein
MSVNIGANNTKRTVVVGRRIPKAEMRYSISIVNSRKYAIGTIMRAIEDSA